MCTTDSTNQTSSLVLRAKRIAVSMYYFSTGVVFASWASRIPDIKHMLHLSDGQLGSILFAIPIGQLCIMAFSGYIVSKFGSKKMLIFATLMYAFVLFLIGFGDSYIHLFVTLIFFGVFANILNIATNTQACCLEKMYGRNIMSSFHGLWSLGGFAGGIIGSFFAKTALPIPVHFATIFLISAVIVFSGARHLVQKDTIGDNGTEQKWSFKHIDPTLILLGLMGFGGMFCEGTVYDWSGVYFSTVVKPSDSLVRLGYIAGMGAMATGRFLADGFVTKYGSSKVLKTCGCLILSGLVMTTTLPYLIPATVGFLLVGFGISSTVPICYSIAGKLGTLKASIAIAAVSSISFLGFLVGPPVIGLLSELTNLRIALSIAACFGLFIAFMASRVEKRTERQHSKASALR